MWTYGATNSEYMTATMFDSVMNRITEIKAIEHDVTTGDLSDPKEVQIIAETNLGQLRFVMPFAWRMDDRDQYTTALVCSTFLNRALELVGLPAEAFPLFDDKDKSAVYDRLRGAVNKIRGHLRGQNA